MPRLLDLLKSKLRLSRFRQTRANDNDDKATAAQADTGQAQQPLAPGAAPAEGSAPASAPGPAPASGSSPAPAPGSSTTPASPPPASGTTPVAAPADDGPRLDVVLRNDTDASQLYAHITGSDATGLVLVAADGRSIHRPPSPSSTVQPLGADCSIALGGPGASRRIQVPQLSGARIWFCKERPLAFFINPGPALVEPSATNTADANYGADWGFCEFTWNAQQIYVNVSFVDFFALPISLRLATADGSVKSVPGMPSDGLARVASALEQQARSDSKGWDKLVVRASPGGRVLRTLSPNAAEVLFPGLFRGYYQSHVDAVWAKYASEDLVVDTQFKWGRLRGRVNSADGRLTFAPSGQGDSTGGAFAKPAAVDIFSCSTGPFAGGQGVTDEQLNLGARLAAALNRSTLLVNSDQPDGEKVETYYREPITNHFSRICHETSVQGRGYAFPYDDVGPVGGVDQSGYINDPNPKELTVAVGKPL